MNFANRFGPSLSNLKAMGSNIAGQATKDIMNSAKKATQDLVANSPTGQRMTAVANALKSGGSKRRHRRAKHTGGSKHKHSKTKKHSLKRRSVHSLTGGSKHKHRHSKTKKHSLKRRSVHNLTGGSKHSHSKTKKRSPTKRHSLKRRSVHSLLGGSKKKHGSKHRVRR